MFCSSQVSILFALSALTAVSFALPKPQYDGVDWTKVNYNVDWSNVNYGNQDSKPSTVVQPAPQVPTPSVVQQAAVSTTKAAVKVAVSTPKPSSKPASSSGSSSSTVSTSSSKRGLAYNYESPSLDIFTSASTIGWGWNWSGNRGNLPAKFEYVPMCWGPGKADTFHKDMASNSGVSHILSFNEPDIDGQAQIDVGTAVAAHIQHLNRYASDKTKIGAVSVSNGHSDVKLMGLDYLKQFLDQCSKQAEPCKVDFCPVHWYGCPAEAPCPVSQDYPAFEKSVKDAVAACNGKPVWLTEFQKIGSEAEQTEFLGKAIPFLESQAGVERYSYFMVKDGMMTTGGQLNGVGKAFVG